MSGNAAVYFGIVILLFVSTVNNVAASSNVRIKAEPVKKFQIPSKDYLALTNAENAVSQSEGYQSNEACKHPFEGFGVHLGAIHHLTQVADRQNTITQLADKIYNDLQLRNFRTSYEPEFSVSDDEYDISCKSDFSCTWNIMHETMAKYPDAKYMASVWSPPYYMRNNATDGLRNDYEEKYYYYMKNITAMMEEKFNIEIELVSLVNEPENFVVSWDHCNMSPHQICRMVQEYDDPLISACTENAWFSITNIYMDHEFSDVSCRRACKTILTHAYQVNFNPQAPEFLRASYDTNEFKSRYEQPIWQTEVSSTYGNAHLNQMEESLRMAKNIIQFVGTTCVSRYYFWTAFTYGYSGESLIWGDPENQMLTFPKKYFVFKQFSIAAYENPNAHVIRCDRDLFPGQCLTFDNGNKETTISVFINSNEHSVLEEKLHDCVTLCCTTDSEDYSCGHEKDGIVPALSVCSCKAKTQNNSSAMKNINAMIIPIFFVLLKILC